MVKARNVMFVQQIDYFKTSNIQSIIKELTDVLKPIRFAGILHDKDIGSDGTAVAPHIHLILQFESARSLNNLAKLTSQPIQCFEQWRGSINNAYSYLVHHTSSDQDKYQYSPKEVIANFDYLLLLDTIERNVTKRYEINDTMIIDNLLDLLYTGNITKSEIEQRLTGSQYAKARQKIETVYLKRLETQAELWRQEMIDKNEIVTIIWLFGKAGTGKTRLARQYAEQYDLNYFITGSIRDPFQQYNLEHVIILDELRPHQFDYSDLLKMFDPYNVKAMASSRYFDKPLLANVYIITSPYSPYNFFLELTKKKQTSHIDSWGQLMRRLSLVVEVKKEHLQFYKYEPMDQMFYIDHGNKLPNPFKNQTDREETIQDKSYQLFLELNKKKERNE
ncbi:Rep family protein [Streptococcus mitis]|uniref:Replication protein n=1 Tax=Streptococcus mitis TaxID=28037 RepID=A0A7X1V402_STRMT|nr:Rep family protein [Streptococcus mitis]MQQ32716.1 replication protein [Streptococcus mitis]MQQ51283.1 replication protein [Streptococcus mitis]